MKYYLMPLTGKESQLPSKKGYSFALANKDRWIDLGDAKDEVNTYDRGTTVLVHENVVYNIFKDYVNIDEQYRVYIGMRMNYDYDVLTKEEDDYEYTSKKGANGKKESPKKVAADQSLADMIEKTKGSDVEIQVASGTFDAPITFNGTEPTVIKGALAGVAANTGVRATSEIGENETVISGTVNVTGDADVTLDGVTFTADSKLNFENYSGTFSVKNCKFAALSKNESGKTMAVNIKKDSMCKLDIRNNYFGSNDGTIYNGLELTGKLADGSVIANNTFAKGFTSHNAINIYNVVNKATVYVNNNHCETVDFARIGIIGEPSCTVSFNGNSYVQTATDEWNNPIIVQPYGKQTTSFRNCLIEIKGTKPSADEDLLVVAYGANDTDVSKCLPVVKIDGKFVTPTVRPF